MAVLEAPRIVENRSVLLDAVGDLGDLVEDLTLLPHESADLAVGVHHRGVVLATKLSTDLGQREISEFTTQIHGDLASSDESLGARGAQKVVSGNVEVAGRLGDDSLGS
ncbi:MAG: hypothetical protein Q613_PSC00107G0001, partial [Propionibacterium sp. DORA_15]